ncbi:WXG100 family type VII secretion target [Nocardioides sp. STR2]|uniref:WXG100 family type VII secretion target n=1 Tax=Nocardioides pini TaxID=2975053 RepID=A0ABT4CET2_9ACTN|nr:WXG100 family type VII secretion target [Nocardioides pini]MCY4726881.1 WXG100 family type VII secretion target [Nocardioides pini]
MTAYDVDLAELRLAVAQLAACQRDLLGLAVDIDHAQDRLQDDWLGRAGDAQASSYDSWRDGCAEMVTSLAALRRIVAAADDHYSSAVDANLALWRQVSG